MIAVSLGLLACVLAGGLLWRRRCLSLVAQASHELRGPLQAALLGLHGIEDPGDGARLAAIDLELRRAARAVEDLSAAAGGRRAADSADDVELGELLADASVAWELLAAHRGVGLVVEPSPVPRRRARRTACGSRRRSRTSSPTRSSTAAGRSACARARPAGTVASRSPTAARACRRPSPSSSPRPAGAASAAVTASRSRR